MFFTEDSRLRPFEHRVRDDNQTGEQEQRFKTEVTGNLTTRQWSEEIPHELGRLVISEDPTRRIRRRVFSEQRLDRRHQSGSRKADAHP